MELFFRNNFWGHFSSRNASRSGKRRGFTLLEVLCTICIFFLIVGGIWMVRDHFEKTKKLMLTRAEMVKLGDLLERYYTIHSDYPKIATHNDQQGTLLYKALHGEIDPDGHTPIAENQTDLLENTFTILDEKLIDPFGSDYIYYYKEYDKSDVWQNPSYVLISRGAKGRRCRNRTSMIPKSVTVTNEGAVSGNLKSDIVMTKGGFL